MRRRFPALRTLPSRTVCTLRRLPISPIASLLPLKAKADVRDATSSARIFVSALMISSVIPSVKNSFSASGLMFVNGSTATDLLSDVAAISAGIAAANALANSDTVEYRSAGSSERAFNKTVDAAGGAFAVAGSRGGGPLNRFAITACGVDATNGGV